MAVVDPCPGGELMNGRAKDDADRAAWACGFAVAVFNLDRADNRCSHGKNRRHVLLFFVSHYVGIIPPGEAEDICNLIYGPAQK